MKDNSLTDSRRRVLVVEDEMLVAMLIEDMLTDLGFEVVGPAMRLEAAMPLATEAELDFAVLDVNLGDRKSFPVAEILRKRGVPFIFATGYGRRGVEESFKDVLTLSKPFESHQLQRALEQTND